MFTTKRWQRSVKKMAFITLLGASVCSAPWVIEAAEKNETFELLNLFGDVFERVRSDYVEPVKDSDLIEAALNGMLASLDPHSGYMNDKAFKEMQVQTKGEFGGLGIEVTMDNGLVKVVSPIDDTPAFKAGVQAGDYISYINDEAVMGLTLSEAVEKMRGAPDSTIKLTILRENAPEPIELTMQRAIINIKASKGRAEGDIAVLRITQFNEQTTDLMRKEMERLNKEMPKIRGVVLDLRNNPGGLLDQAVSVSDAFLSEGEIVSTRERDPVNTKRYSAKSGDELVPNTVPMVVLINTGSASASEIVSGALQDHKRAIVLGTKSFGKGSVQTVIPLENHGAIRLTTARYYTPSGHSIQAKGITPDIEVEQAKIEPIKNDKMRVEADLRRRLQNLEDEKNRLKKDKDKDKDKDGKPVDPAGKDKDPKEKEKEKSKPKDKEAEAPKDLKKSVLDNPQDDFQLQRALDLLRGLSFYKEAAKLP